MYLYEDHLITAICKVYGALWINLLTDIVFAFTEIMLVVLFLVPFAGQSLT